VAIFKSQNTRTRRNSPAFGCFFGNGGFQPLTVRCVVPYSTYRYLMRSPGSPTRLACLLLVLAFVGAQQHFCADSTSGGSGPHVCQVCATAGHAVATQAAVTEFSLAITRLEAPSPQREVASVFFSLTAPRAPPSL
jgi:hypothetical protein